MKKGSLWATVAVVNCLSLINLLLFANTSEEIRSYILPGVFRIVFGLTFDVLMVALTNEKRRWPLIILIVTSALYVPVGILWIAFNGSYPRGYFIFATVVAVVAACAFSWHYLQYKKTVWK